MTVERIEIRRIISQMLADEGINRKTIKDFVRDVVEEKVSKALAESGMTQEIEDRVSKTLNKYIHSEVQNDARRCVEEAIRKEVHSYFHQINVTLEFNEPDKTTF